MSYSVIKRELKSEGQKLLRSSKYRMKQTKGLDFFKEYPNHLKKADDLGEDLTKILNKLIEKHNIEFENEGEKDVLLGEVNPIIKEILQDFVKP